MRMSLRAVRSMSAGIALTMRQTLTLLPSWLSAVCLLPPCRACVRFRFLQRPEYITPGTRFVFREGRTKGIGVVLNVGAS